MCFIQGHVSYPDDDYNYICIHPESQFTMWSFTEVTGLSLGWFVVALSNLKQWHWSALNIGAHSWYGNYL